jgi:hypothetical protein
MQSDTEFDIRTPVGRDGLAHYHITSDRQDTLTAGEILDGLACLVNRLKPRDWMIWRYGGFALPTGHKSQRWLTVPEAVELGSALQVVSRCDGFPVFIQGFENPAQFDDAFFEARLARWCVERPTVKTLRFAPSYSVLGRQKRPDFEIRTPVGRLVCECKRLHLNTQDWAVRLTRIADAFDAAMKDTPIAPEVRLEVVIHRPIHGDLPTVAAEACRQALSAQDGTAVEFGPFSLRLSRVGSPVSPSDCVIQHGRIRVGATPTGITPENNYLRVSSPWMERALVRTMGTAINLAHRQLPHDRASVIFIDGPRHHGRQAAVARLTQPEYAHCVAIGVFRGGEIEFSRRNIDEQVVDWLFLGRTPSLARRLQHIIVWRSGLRLALTREILRRASKTRAAPHERR